MTNSNRTLVVGFAYRAPPRGGPGSFQTRLINALEKQNHKVVYPEDGVTPDVILVVGGTAKFGWLIKSKLRGSKIIHRLDGINWRHTVDDVSFAYKLKSELRNLIVWTIKTFLLIILSIKVIL